MGPTIKSSPLLEDLRQQEEAEEEEDKSDEQSGKPHLASPGMRDRICPITSLDKN